MSGLTAPAPHHNSAPTSALDHTLSSNRPHRHRLGRGKAKQSTLDVSSPLQFSQKGKLSNEEKLLDCCRAALSIHNQENKHTDVSKIEQPWISSEVCSSCFQDLAFPPPLPPPSTVFRYLGGCMLVLRRPKWSKTVI